uniref:Sterile alpha motif domain-containing protein 3 n=1 Tax=Dicentrarchus labrax TaxID=13489 RepID=A0A8C4HHH8_DICLA
MAAAQKHVLRVYVARDTALKLTLLERPKSVEELKEIMQERFKPRLDGDFSLHYEDPDFDGDLCLLVDIQELPEKGTLRVVRPEGDTSSTASSDTDLLPHVPALQRQKSWPDHFVVPGFGYEIEHILEEGNRVYEESGQLLKLKRSQKSEILKKMEETIYSFKPYPHEKELAMAAQALITAHPCLRMTAGEDGELGWKRHVGYKVASYRHNLAKAGVAEVAVNIGKWSRNNPDNDHPHQNIKKARKAEVNYLINLPKDQTPATLETLREEIIHEVEKTEQNQLVIGKLMNTTYALRRQEIVGVLVAPQVRDVVDRWPALLMESQVFAEFHRINNVNLRNQFYKELDRHTPKLITLFRDKATKTGKIAEELAKQALVLRALPVYLREDASKFFRTCNSADGPDLTDTPVALLTVATDDTTDAALFSPESICIVVEDEILVSGPTNLADSFLLLFGYVYALDLQYPKNLELTFTFIQKVVMCLEDNKPLKGRLLTLKNDLFNE